MNKEIKNRTRTLFIEPDFESYHKMIERGNYLLSDQITKKNNGIEIPLMGNSSHKVFASSIEARKGAGSLHIVVKPHANVKAMNNEIKALRRIREINDPNLPSVKLVGGMYLPNPQQLSSERKPIGFLYLEKENLSSSLDSVNINNLERNQREKILQVLAKHIAKMHSVAKIYHGDLRAKNILLKFEPHVNEETGKTDYPRFYLMDMENSTIDKMTLQARISDMKCLARDLDNRLKIRNGVFVNQICVPYETERKKIEGSEYQPIDWFKVFNVDYHFK